MGLREAAAPDKALPTPPQGRAEIRPLSIPTKEEQRTHSGLSPPLRHFGNCLPSSRVSYACSYLPYLVFRAFLSFISGFHSTRWLCSGELAQAQAHTHLHSP